MSMYYNIENAEIDCYLLNHRSISIDSFKAKIQMSEHNDKNGILAYFLIRNRLMNEALSLLKRNDLVSEGVFSQLSLTLLHNQDNENHSDIIDALERLNNQHTNIWVKYELCLLHIKNSNNEYLNLLDEIKNVASSKCSPYKILLAYSLGTEKNCDRVVELLKPFEEIGDEEVVTFLAEAYYNCKNIEKAVELYNKSLSISPNPYGFHGLGIIYTYDLKNDELAKEMFLNALNIEPTFYQAVISLGWISYFNGKIDFAQSQMLQGLEISEYSMDALSEYVLFHIYSNNIERGIEFLKILKGKYGETSIGRIYEIVIGYRIGSIGDVEIDTVISDYIELYGDEKLSFLLQLIYD